jgi:hypothetical protein
MTSKWYLRDWLSPQRTVVGTLRDVHNSNGDNDTKSPSKNNWPVWVV